MNKGVIFLNLVIVILSNESYNHMNVYVIQHPGDFHCDAMSLSFFLCKTCNKKAVDHAHVLCVRYLFTFTLYLRRNMTGKLCHSTLATGNRTIK